jgi:hypothetical protein
VQHFEIDVCNWIMLPGSLSYTNPITTARYQLAAAYYNRYIYVVGGSSSSSDLLNDVEYGVSKIVEKYFNGEKVHLN